MMYLAFFILIFELMRLLIALSNALFFQRLRNANHNFSGLISVLIPARNEEKNISKILGDLIKQDYTHIEIIVFNDSSTDKTREIVSEYAQTDSRIQLVNSKGLPAGWLGKNYACYNLARQAKGNYLLFLDADVRLGSDTISKSIAFAQKYRLGLLSVFPRQLMITKGEWLTVPIMNYILLSLLPLLLVRISGFKSLAAANGQFMFFEAAKYKKYLPHELLKSEKVEDIAIARFYKEKKEKIACLTTTGSIECRMYSGFNEAVNGFSKNVVSYFGNSFLVATAFWLITGFGFVVVWLGLGVKLLAVYFLLTILIKILVSFVSNQNIFKNLFYLIPHQFVLGLFLWKAFVNKKKNRFEWKGRILA